MVFEVKPIFVCFKQSSAPREGNQQPHFLPLISVYETLFGFQDFLVVIFLARVAVSLGKARKSSIVLLRLEEPLLKFVLTSLHYYIQLNKVWATASGLKYLFCNSRTDLLNASWLNFFDAGRERNCTWFVAPPSGGNLYLRYSGV